MGKRIQQDPNLLCLHPNTKAKATVHSALRVLGRASSVLNVQVGLASRHTFFGDNELPPILTIKHGKKRLGSEIRKT